MQHLRSILPAVELIFLRNLEFSKTMETLVEPVGCLSLSLIPQLKSYTLRRIYLNHKRQYRGGRDHTFFSLDSPLAKVGWSEVICHGG
jgi:hypothetical protein